MYFFTGLSELSNGELLDLKQEMAAYIKEYSDVLIEELTLREELEREKEVKNKFISTLLTVQSKIRELQSGQTKGKKGFSTNSGKVNIICMRELTLNCTCCVHQTSTILMSCFYIYSCMCTVRNLEN